MALEKLLIVEDNEGLREQMKWALNSSYAVNEAASAEACIEQFKRQRPRLVTLDMGLDNIPDRGSALIDDILAIDRSAKIIVITAHTSEDLGKKAIAKGAFDFLKKPVDVEELKVILSRAARILELEGPLTPAGAQSIQSAPNFEMVGQSKPMLQIYEIIRKIAQTDVNVLITGDSGTGKELCARAIHFHSMRKNKPFVPINCGAIPENLLESELFGYMKGAFTGAGADKMGLIESANLGTLFLDEIGDMPKHLQVKVLRFCEDQVFQRVGDTQFRQADVRIIAATNKKNLAVEGNDAMRTDLYYRLSEFEIHLPALSERGADVLLLAEKINERNRGKFGMPKLKLSTRAEQLLLQYSWPGNVRELENRLSRAAITCVNQVIEPEDLQLSPTSFTNLTFKDARNMFEKDYVINLLRKSNYNISVAADIAAVSRPTLYDLMRKHDVAVKFEGKIEG